MSLSALPWWVYETLHEIAVAKSLCAFDEEVYSATLKTEPAHIYQLHSSNFKSWEPGGWNYELD
jgi:hypothetical protein